MSSGANGEKIICDLADVGATELNSILRRFYAEVKTNKDKKILTPSALTGIRAANRRKSKSQPISSPINILKDSEFLQANKMFEVVRNRTTKKVIQRRSTRVQSKVEICKN